MCIYVFLLKVKYTGNEMEVGETEKKGLNVMDKTLDISGARISYSIWEVEGILLSFWVCILFGSYISAPVW